MENQTKKSKISLSKPSDIPDSETQQVELPTNPVQSSYTPPQQQQQQYQQTQQTYSQPQPTYQPTPARRLSPDVPNTYQQTNPPVPVNNNTPYQSSNYARNNGTSTATKFCKFCGATIPFDAVVCTQCGRQVEQLQQSGNNYQQNNTYINNVNINDTLSDKTKGMAAILCCLGFLGLGGIHRIYTGKIVSGVVYFLTCGLFGIGTVIDLIAIIAGGFTDELGRRLR